MTKPKENPQVAGRPTDYRPEYGREILNLMATGLSLAAAAADLGFHRQRVYEWVDRHPEFADTISLAKSKRQLFLERRLLSAEQGPVVTSTIFALKNAAGEDWRDKVVTEHAGEIGMTVSSIDAAKLSPEQRDQLRGIMKAASGKAD